MKIIQNLLAFIFIFLSFVLVLPSCNPSEDDMVEVKKEYDNCTVYYRKSIKNNGIAGVIRYGYDDSNRLIFKVKTDSTGITGDTTWFIYNLTDKQVKTIIEGGYTYEITHTSNTLVKVERKTNQTVWSTDNYVLLENGHIDSVIEVWQGFTYPIGVFTFEYDGNNMSKITHKEDRDDDGVLEYVTVQEMKFDNKKNPFSIMPSKWLYAGNDRSENNITQKEQTNNNGSQATRNYLYEYNASHYPTKIISGSTENTVEYTCE